MLGNEGLAESLQGVAEGVRGTQREEKRSHREARKRKCFAQIGTVEGVDGSQP